MWSDQRKANTLFGELSSLRKILEPVRALAEEVRELEELAKASPDDLASLEVEYEKVSKKWQSLETQLYLSGPHDAKNVFMTVSGGAGGTEAQDFAAMLLRMYLRYAERKGWKTEFIDRTDGQEAGIKSATILVQGTMAYGYLKCERGTHRLVRLSPFNAKSLRQTSFALVEVLPDLGDDTSIDIRPEDLRIDTFRSGGAGGQHVNKTESAVRITHVPTNIVVACQTERSQIQNRERAMAMLKAKLLEKKEGEEAAERARLKGSTKSADFGSQIRSYVLHPYQMVKDLRTEYETSDTQGVLDGDLDAFIDAELKRAARE